MDYSLIGIVATAITTAKDIGRTAIGIRDFNQFASAISQINDHLLKAQDSLFAHNAQLLELQQQNFQLAEEVRALKEAASERSRYTLFEFPRGDFAYRMNVSPELGGASDPTGSEPPHYICQPCYDNGRKVVLQPYYLMGKRSGLECSVCKTRVIDA